MRRSSSFVGILSRRAASEARSRSADTCASLTEAQSTAQQFDLMFELGQHGHVVAVAEDVPGVLQRGEQGQSFFHVIRNTCGGLTIGQVHPGPTLGWSFWSAT